MKIFYHDNQYEYAIFKIAAILRYLQCDNITNIIQNELN